MRRSAPCAGGRSSGAPGTALQVRHVKMGSVLPQYEMGKVAALAKAYGCVQDSAAFAPTASRSTAIPIG